MTDHRPPREHWSTLADSLALEALWAIGVISALWFLATGQVLLRALAVR